MNKCKGCQGTGTVVNSDDKNYNYLYKCDLCNTKQPKSFHDPCPYGNDDCPKCRLKTKQKDLNSELRAEYIKKYGAKQIYVKPFPEHFEKETEIAEWLSSAIDKVEAQTRLDVFKDLHEMIMDANDANSMLLLEKVQNIVLTNLKSD